MYKNQNECFIFLDIGQYWFLSHGPTKHQIQSGPWNTELFSRLHVWHLNVAIQEIHNYRNISWWFLHSFGLDSIIITIIGGKKFDAYETSCANESTNIPSNNMKLDTFFFSFEKLRSCCSIIWMGKREHASHVSGIIRSALGHKFRTKLLPWKSRWNLCKKIK